MAGKKIRLFKIASEINIGKDTIVDFLKGKGYDIENKSTASLTEDMQEAVYEKFKKEKRAAEVQRTKIQKHKDIKKSSDDTSAPEQPKAAAPSTSPPPSAPAKEEPDVAPKAEEKPKVSEPTAEVAPKEEKLPEAPAKPEPPQAKAEEPKEKEAPAPKEELQTEAPKAEIEKKEEAPKAEEKETKAQEEKAEPKEQAQTEKSEDTPKKVNEPQAGQVIDLKALTPSQSKGKPSAKPTKPAPKPEPAAPKQERKQKKDKPRRLRASDIEIRPTYAGRKDDKEITRIEASSPKPVDEEPDTQAPSADNKLKGLKVMGKIELKTEEPRKRKRSRKSIDVNKELKKGKEGAKGRGGRDAGKGDDRGTEARSPRPNRSEGDAANYRSGGGGAPGGGGNFRSGGPGGPGGGGGYRGGGGDGDDRRKKKRGKSIRDQISQKDVNRAIKQTLAGFDGGTGKQSYKKRKAQKREEKEQLEQEQRELEERTLSLTEFVTTSDLANLMNVPVTEVIAKCMMLGRMVTINQRLDKETIELIATDYDFEVDFIEEEQFTQIEDEEDDEEDLQPRPPIVTIMGHVDHGKTSLLDYMRNSQVVAGEAGGITQHIGAYMVDHEGKNITFLDTPGHEAFTAMRARGAEVTDIVVLVVAADDSVMPQTLEAISHAKAAEVPMIVAINKIDKPEANAEKIRQQLAENDVLVEDWGGKFQAVEISAKFGKNIDQLLESILLEAEILELKANPDRRARATVVEAHMDKGLGAVATVVMQKGTLTIGEPFIAGAASGRIRAMFDERDNRIESAGPSVPVRIIGFDGVPEAGDVLIAMESDSEAKNVAQQRQQLKREQELRQKRHVTLDDIATQIKLGGVQTLNLILKGDVSGSVEALSDSLLKLSTQEVKVNIILKGVGAISESDVQLAMASDAVIIGFHQAPSVKARALADIEQVEIRQYDIIYDCIEDIENALEGLLAPDLEERIKGRAEIRVLYKISRMGTIAGCHVLEGKIERKDKVRLMRDGIKVWEGGIQTLKREKDDVKEVREGFECGIFLDGYNDIQEEDIIEAYEMYEVKRTLSQSK